MSSRRALGRTVRLAIACLLALLLVPDSTRSPASISLTTVDTAKRVDFGEDIVWVLVLGSDARPGQEVTEGNTDAIHLVGIDGRTGRAVGIGVPRDAWLELPGHGMRRINEALDLGGRRLAAEVIGGLVDIQPDYVLVTGFEGFVEMMSAVGAIEVVAPEGFTNDGTVVKEGLNTFAPDQVLDFVRYRHLVGDDFARSANQQRALVATLEGMRAQEDDEGFMERATLAAVAGLETDLGPTELYRFAQAVTQVDPRKVTSCILPGSPDETFGGASVVILDEVAAARIGADARDVRLQGGCEP